MTRPDEHRIERRCDVCGQWDTDPRHEHSDVPGAGFSRHMDCCAATGCPDLSCDQTLADAGEKRGAALVEHLTKGGK